MEFNNQRSIYLQIADSIQNSILEGILEDGDKLDSVREFAGKIGVNPNTVMRAYSHLQGQEIIANKRGIGFFVANDASKKIKEELRAEFLQNELPAMIRKMELLGIDFAKIEHLFKRIRSH